MRETTVNYWCDFNNSNVDRHTAIIGIRNGKEGVPADTEEFCLLHFPLRIIDIFRSDPKAKVDLRLLDVNADFSTIVDAKKRFGPCEVCGRSFQSASGFSGHKRNFHKVDPN